MGNTPGFVKFISILFWLGAIGYILFGAFWLFVFSAESSTDSNSTKYMGITYTGVMATILPIVLIILGILFIFVALGLWRAKLWARDTAIILYIMGIIFGIFAIVQGVWSIGILWIVVNATIAAYLIWNNRARIAFS